MIDLPHVAMRTGLSGIVTLLNLHLQLLLVEWEQEKRRLRQMLFTLLFGLSLFLCTLLCVIALVITLSWETAYRLQSIGLLVVIFGGGAFFAWYRLSKLHKQGADSFADSSEEFAADIASLRNRFYE
jgi:uncharacterized membrane protein YqjE